MAQWQASFIFSDRACFCHWTQHDNGPVVIQKRTTACSATVEWIVTVHKSHLYYVPLAKVFSHGPCPPGTMLQTKNRGSAC